MSDDRPTELAGDQAGPPRTRTVLADSEAIRVAEADVAPVWKPGDRVLDLYDVTKVHEGGGMGLVYRVRHLDWEIDLAVKSPRPDFFKTETQKQNFIAECETWIQLGMHAHIVSCYYVRRLGGIPRVFAEYVRGGSLSDWIRSGRLYEGDRSEWPGRVLDIAIQCAWGLYHAHSQRIVHQDFKPANVMVTRQGVAKVTDFGLARAQAAVQEHSELSLSGPLVKVLGMTPAYCSPEQAIREPLSLKTDIWSWGLSVLEMLAGEVTWRMGLAAPDVLEQMREPRIAKSLRVPIPEGLADLLARCFREDPDQRPADFRDVVRDLRRCYEDVTGTDYEREPPRPAEALADGQNNAGVSFLDLGHRKEAEEAFLRALARDPQHPEANYNHGLLMWQVGRMTDDALVKRMEEVRRSHPGDWRPLLLLGLTHLERGDARAAAEALERPEAQKAGPELERNLTLARRAEDSWGGCTRTATGLPGRVLAVDVVPASEYVAVAAGRRVRLIPLSPGHPSLPDLEGHGEEVRSVSFSLDGKWVVSGGADAGVRLWHLGDQECRRVLRGHRGPVNSVSFSPNSRWALSGGADHHIRLWDLPKGVCARSFKGHADEVLAVRFLADGKHCVTAGADRAIRFWNLAKGGLVAKLTGHRDLVNSLAVCDGRMLSGGHDQTVRLWDLARRECLLVMEGHTGPVNSVHLNSDWGLSGGDDGTVRLFDLVSGRCVRTFSDHRGRVKAVRLLPAGDVAVSGGDDNRVKFYRLRGTHREIGRFRVSLPRSGEELAASEDTVSKAIREAEDTLDEGRMEEALRILSKARAVPGHERNPELVRLWKRFGEFGQRVALRDAWNLEMLTDHRDGVSAVDLSPGGEACLTASFDRAVRLFDVDGGKCRNTLTGHVDEVLAARYGPDGARVLTGSADRTVRVWNPVTGECERVLEGHRDWVNAVAFAPDGRRGISGSTDETVRLWDLTTGEALAVAEDHTASVQAVAVCPDGRLAATGGQDRTLVVRDLATLEPRHVLQGHRDWVNGVAFAPSGDRIASCAGDGTIRLWAVEGGECLRILDGAGDWPTDVRFLPDGRYLLSASQDGKFRLWDLEAERVIRVFEGHSGSVESVAVSGDGVIAISGSDDRTALLWQLDWEYEVEPTSGP